MRKAYRIHFPFLIILIFGLMNVSSMFGQYGHWEKLNPKDNPGERWGHELSAIGENKAILFGGDRKTRTYLNDTWIFDFNLREWFNITCKNSPSGLAYYSLTQISKNKVLLFGGEADSIIEKFGNFRNDLWIFDLDSMNWYKLVIDTSNIIDARYRHRASLLNDSLVLIFSGHSYYWGFTNDILLFNFRTNKMSKNLQRNPLIYPREFTQMDRIKDNLIFIFGGNTGSGDRNDNLYIDAYIQMQEITNLKNNCIPQSQAGMKHLRDGIFLMFGGNGISKYYNSTWYDGTWVFDFYNKYWEELDLDLNPIGRLEPGVAKIDSNKILMYGGLIKNAPDQSYKTETWIFTLDSVPASVLDNLENSQLIYPNPATDFIEISIGANGRSPLLNTIKIYNVFGQKVLSVGVQNLDPLRIDVSTFPSGMYFVCIGDRVGKFVKL